MPDPAEADPADRVSVEDVLEHAKERNYAEVIVIGLTEDRDITVASSTGALADVYFLIEHAKRILLDFGVKEHVYGDR